MTGCCTPVPDSLWLPGQAQDGKASLPRMAQYATQCIVPLRDPALWLEPWHHPVAASDEPRRDMSRADVHEREAGASCGRHAHD